MINRLFAILSCVVFLNANAQNEVRLVEKNLFTLQDIWFSRDYAAKGVPGLRSMNDGISYCQLDAKENKTQDCNRYEIKTGKLLNTIFSAENIQVDGKPIIVSSFEFSENEKKVIITNEFEAVYRHSGKSFTYLYDLETKTITKVNKNKVAYPSLSPDGNKIAYVSENNLFVYDVVKKKTIQVTKDGEKNKIINGAVDWVYEEEFSMSRGFEWSNNSEYLAYYKFDESNVPEFSMDIYGSLYPKKEVWKYPKAGESNSKVDVYIYQIASKKSKKCETNSDSDQYLPRIKWMSDSYLSVQRLNRHQNYLEVLAFSFQLLKPRLLYEEKNAKYIDINDLEFDVHANKQNIVREVYYLSEKSGFNHLHKRTLTDFYGQKTPKTHIKDEQLTEGNWDIDQFLGIDKTNQKAYYTSGGAIHSDRQLFEINLKDLTIKQITTLAGWHQIKFSATFDFFVDQHSDFNTPPITTIKNREGEIVRTLQDNKALIQKLETTSLGTTSFSKFKTTEGIELDYWKIVPRNFDSSKKYPILFFVYGGPGYQTVKNQWGGAQLLWYHYMANKGYVVITIDNRGSGAKGEEFKKCTYLNLGKYETQDYIEGAKYFGNQTWADKTRIGIFGWSYGGFMASNCITKGADYFKTAVAVAPVSNWRFYDNIYTERYMRTPQENASGYDDNSPINHVEKIKGKYLIIHGTADDNVHFQNAAEMVKAMNEKNIPYDAEYYPNYNHSIVGGKIRWHLFNKISSFIEQNL